jgi:hypothetical protein
MTKQGESCCRFVGVDAKHDSVYLAGGRIVGIDPDHRGTPTISWRAFELTRSMVAR